VDLPDGRTIEYVHDPLGRRIARKIDGTITEKYLWSGRTTLLAVFDGADNLLMRFEYADGRMPVAMTRGGDRYFLACDQVGTLRVVTDPTGAVVKRIDYDTFGNVVADTNPAFSVPFGFAGGLHDRDTGLARFGYRDYDPETGRWTAKDPILFAGGDLDLYGYCLNDPVNWVDPDGLFVDSSGVYTGITTIAAEATGASVAATGGAIAAGVVAGVGAYVGMPTALEYYDLDVALTWWGDLAYDLIHAPATTETCAGRKKWEKKSNRKKQGREPAEKKRQKKNWKPRNPPKEPPRHTPSRKN
jgi:RHS repeat-associated protein